MVGSTRWGLGRLRPLAHRQVVELFAPRELAWVPGDPGLFGPESATWQVHADVSVFLGAIRALLCQAMHPEVVAGVVQHSAYEADPLGRLQRTAEWVAQVSYAPTEQATAAIDALAAVHARVQGRSERGIPYRADEPGLLAWVANTLTESFATAYELFGPAHDPALLDDYCAEMAGLGQRLGADECPITLAELRAWIVAHPAWDDSAGRRQAHEFLATPPLGARSARSVYRRLHQGAAASIPAPLDLLVAPTWPGAVPAARATVAGMRAVLGHSTRLDEARARVAAT